MTDAVSFAPPASFAEIISLLAAVPPLPDAPPTLQAGARIDVALFAGPHGGTETDWPALLRPWQDGTAPAAQIFATIPALDLHLFELAGAPIGDSTVGPALAERAAAHAMAYGMMAAKEDLGLLILSTVGDAATGADASALAVIAALLKRAPETLSRDATAIARADAALAANRARLTDPLTILAALGGHESCAILGAILAARLGGIPIWLEGGPALAAALVLAQLAGNTPAASDLLAHAQATSIPAALQSAFSGALKTLSPAPAAPAGDARQAAAALQAQRVASRTVI